MTDHIAQIAQTLMRAVVATGAVRDQDTELACRVMLAFASIAAECIRRILAERDLEAAL